MPSCIASLDAIIMCSDHEGTPMTALEALALGTPLIAHDVGGLKEIFQDYKELMVLSNLPNEYCKKIAGLVARENVEPKLPNQFTAIQNSTVTLELYSNSQIKLER
jgi:L-malate glycosyltransferase